ncbi:MAG: hypothetical protein ABJG16_09650, partial [Maribacter dokdonensis]
DKHTLNSIFNESHTDCFGLSELDLTVNGEHSLKANGSFFVAVIYYGEGTIISGGKEYSFAQGDEIFFSAAIEEVVFKSKIASKILLCYPPK